MLPHISKNDSYFDLHGSVSEDIERDAARDFENILRVDILGLTFLPNNIRKYLSDLLENAKIIAT
jgi:hypothetical protein